MSNRFLIVATEVELQLPLAVAAVQGGYRQPVVTGVGATNVIQALRKLPRHADILNVGYCGSNRYPVGAVVWIADTRLWHPNVDFREATFHLMDGAGATCMTAGDFVLDGEDLPAKSVVDMELAYIAAFGFQSLRAVKYVSDNLNLQQYEKTLRHETHQR